jgi:glutaredoxin
MDAVYFDVKADDARLEEMLKLSGGARKVPVIVRGEKVTIGYGGL